MPTESFIPGKDASLESSIATMQGKLEGPRLPCRGAFLAQSRRWRLVGACRDRDCPLLFTNGKGGSRLAALASALGEFFERLSCNYFWTTLLAGRPVRRARLRALPARAWFQPGPDGEWPEQLLTPELRALYNPNGSIDADALVDLNSGAAERGICALPYQRLRDGADGLVPGQHHRQPLRQQRHVGRQHPDGGAHPGPVGNPRAPRQVPHHRRGPVPARRAGACHRPLPGIAAGIRRPARRRLRHPGQGRLARRRIPGDERHPAASRRPGLLLQLRRPPALRDRPRTRPHRAAAGPRPELRWPASRAGLRPRRDRQRHPTSKSTSSIPAASSAGTSSATHRTSNSATGTSAIPRRRTTTWSSASTAPATTSTSPTSGTSASTPAASWCRACPRSIRWTTWNGRTTASATRYARPSCTCRTRRRGMRRPARHPAMNWTCRTSARSPH
jgi:hypothetical protein